MLLCFSDGLTESCSRDGRQLGAEGVLELLRSLPEVKSDSLLPNLLETVGSQYPANLENDDVTVLLIEATDTRVAMRDNFLAPFRLLRTANDRTCFVNRS
jgi:hypothetical protein